MKYRRLSNDEIQKLSEEFTAYLESHNLSKDKWKQLQASKADEADSLVEHFSDLIFDNLLTGIRHIERKESNFWEVMQINDDGIEIISVNVNPNALVDLTNPDCIEDLATHDAEELSRMISIAKSERKVNQGRLEDVFKLIETGYYAVDSSVYRALERLYDASMSPHLSI